MAEHQPLMTMAGRSYFSGVAQGRHAVLAAS
jgi:hypothetical protein